MQSVKKTELSISTQSQQSSQIRKQQFQSQSVIRKLISKRYITQIDIQQLIDVISNSHISLWKRLSRFFANFQIEFKLSDSLYKNKLRSCPKNRFHLLSYKIQLSQYFNCGNLISLKIFADLAEVIERKFNLYEKKNPAKLYNKFSYSNINKIQQQYFQEKNSNQEQNQDKQLLRQFYPQAYKLQKTIQTHVSFMKQFYQFKKNQAQAKLNQFLKDRLMLRIMENIQIASNVVNQSFNKDFIYEQQSILFDDEEFYTIKQHTEKFIYYASGGSPKYGHSQSQKQQIYQIQNLTPISAKCAGCIPFMYKNRKLPRQRCSVMNFQVLDTIDDKRDMKKFKQLVQAFMNYKNGGIILFNCIDEFFNVKPQGFECSLKVFQQKKQSLIDICKNIFPDLKIDRDFFIDFVLLKDPAALFNKMRNNRQMEKDAEFIGRFRILKKKPQLLQLNNEMENMETNYQYIYMNNCVKRVGKANLDKLIRKQIIRNDPKMIQTLQQSSQISCQQILDCLRCRLTPLIRHQGNNCRQKPLQFYNDKRQVTQQSRTSINQTQNQITQSQFSNNNMLSYSLNTMIQQLPNWCLLVVNVNQLQKIQSHMKQFFEDRNFIVEAPFQDCNFGQVKNTLLIKMIFSQEEFVNAIKSEQSQQNRYFRTMKKDAGYVQLTHIKVYEYVLVTYDKNMPDDVLIDLRKRLTSQIIMYFSKKRQDNNRAEKLGQNFEISFFVNPNKTAVYITTNDQHPSYALLWIYYFFKNQSSTKNQSVIKVEFKKHWDFIKQKEHQFRRKQQALSSMP